MDHGRPSTILSHAFCVLSNLVLLLLLCHRVWLSDVYPYGIQVMRLMQGRDPLYDNIPGCGVDPRNLAQRIMAVCVAANLLRRLSTWLALSC